MTPGFTVRTTRHFDRLARALRKQHPDVFGTQFAAALAILREDPYNRTGQYAIQKLHGVVPGQGQHRLRMGRWRFRYDIAGTEVMLVWCGLRREDTYR
jgi:hypothetical protein